MRVRFRKYSQDQLRDAVVSSRTYREVLIKLGLSQSGSSYGNIQKSIAIIGADTSHFLTRSEMIKCLFSEGKMVRLDDSVVFCEKSNVRREIVKNRLVTLGLRKYECEECGQLPIWRGRKITLILDHKNGVRNDNRIDNLRFLCPNCNATLDTHCVGSNSSTGRIAEYESADEGSIPS